MATSGWDPPHSAVGDVGELTSKNALSCHEFHPEVPRERVEPRATVRGTHELPRGGVDPVRGLVSPLSTHSFLGPTSERADPEAEGMLASEVAQREWGSQNPSSMCRACRPTPQASILQLAGRHGPSDTLLVAR